MAEIYEAKITDLIPDDKNANKHTPRGQSMLETGMRKLGAGRSVLIDKNRKLIAGNLTQEVAVDIGLEDVIIVPSDGTKLVAVQRTDIDLDTSEGRELAVSDNRIAQVSIDFDGEVLAGLQAEQVDLSWLFYEDELAGLLNEEKVGPEDSPYSQKVEAPLYQPSQTKPAVSELFDDSRTKALIKDIEAATFLSDDERSFLIAAAQRFTVLNFRKIAYFYAHSPAPVQRLMENSALIIIDFNRAIELGFMRLTEEIASLEGEEYGAG